VSAPRFTVLMPTHYRPDTIGYAIRSVLNQTAGDFELLVVGDGATPDTAAVVQSFTDPRIKWFDLPKAPGFGYANRNIAMEQSTGELVVFSADDDVMLPDHLERLGSCFADPAVKWAYSQALWVSTDGIAAPDLTNLENDDERAAFARGNTISGGSLMFRVAAMPSRRCWPEHVKSSGDWEQMTWLLRQYGLGGMRRLAEPTYLHFTAGRKGNMRNSGFALLGAWLALADTVEWWPAALKPDLAGRPAQQVYLDLIERDPDYARQLRAAATDICNRVALGALSPRWPATATVDVAVLAEMERLRVALAAARRENEAIRNSTTWRLLTPVRRVVERLRRSPR
jgi:glycosyltransferase involved in cell wall biosynthesis